MDCIDNGQLIAKRLEDAQLFTTRFGSFNKGDYEVLLFSIYLDMLDRPARDYEISLDLGITESKVRSLRVKSQLLYPRSIDWKKQLQQSIEHGYYDRNSHTITVMIEDPSALNMIKNKIELAYGVVHIALNAKNLSIPLEGYLLLASSLETNQEEALRRLNMKIRKENKEISEITKESLSRRIWNKTSDIGTILSVIVDAKELWTAAGGILGAVINLIR